MTLRDAVEGQEYTIKAVKTNDEELDAFLFSLGCYSGERITVISHRKSSCTVSIKDGKQIFITGHSEYDSETLNKEYVRDKTAGLPIEVPKNYFPEDDDSKAPRVTWRSHANLLFSNWLNYYVYQITPYNMEKIK